MDASLIARDAVVRSHEFVRLMRVRHPEPSPDLDVTLKMLSETAGILETVERLLSVPSVPCTYTAMPPYAVAVMDELERITGDKARNFYGSAGSATEAS